jgi:predicted pyridoxine 5'-phosphate oxidase superfamily flavin-nucleotide-binding protein
VARVGTVEALRKIIGSPNEQVPLKIHRDLNARAIEFIGKSPMLMLATSDAAGPRFRPRAICPGSCKSRTAVRC